MTSAAEVARSRRKRPAAPATSGRSSCPSGGRLGSITGPEGIRTFYDEQVRKRRSLPAEMPEGMEDPVLRPLTPSSGDRLLRFHLGQCVWTPWEADNIEFDRPFLEELAGTVAADLQDCHNLISSSMNELSEEAREVQEKRFVDLDKELLELMQAHSIVSNHEAFKDWLYDGISLDDDDKIASMLNDNGLIPHLSELDPPQDNCLTTEVEDFLKEAFDLEARFSKLRPYDWRHLMEMGSDDFKGEPSNRCRMLGADFFESLLGDQRTRRNHHPCYSFEQEEIATGNRAFVQRLVEDLVVEVALDCIEYRERCRRTEEEALELASGSPRSCSPHLDPPPGFFDDENDAGNDSVETGKPSLERNSARCDAATSSASSISAGGFDSFIEKLIESNLKDDNGLQGPQEGSISTLKLPQQHGGREGLVELEDGTRRNERSSCSEQIDNCREIWKGSEVEDGCLTMAAIQQSTSSSSLKMSRSEGSLREKILRGKSNASWMKPEHCTNMGNRSETAGSPETKGTPEVGRAESSGHHHHLLVGLFPESADPPPSATSFFLQLPETEKSSSYFDANFDLSPWNGEDLSEASQTTGWNCSALNNLYPGSCIDPVAESNDLRRYLCQPSQSASKRAIKQDLDCSLFERLNWNGSRQILNPRNPPEKAILRPRSALHFRAFVLNDLDYVPRTTYIRAGKRWRGFRTSNLLELSEDPQSIRRMVLKEAHRPQHLIINNHHRVSSKNVAVSSAPKKKLMTKKLVYVRNLGPSY